MPRNPPKFSLRKTPLETGQDTNPFFISPTNLMDFEPFYKSYKVGGKHFGYFRFKFPNGLAVSCEGTAITEKVVTLSKIAYVHPDTVGSEFWDFPPITSTQGHFRVVEVLYALKKMTAERVKDVSKRRKFNV